MQYLDLFKYVQLMADALKRWVDDPVKMLTETEPVFPDFSHDTTGPFWSAAVVPPHYPPPPQQMKVSSEEHFRAY